MEVNSMRFFRACAAFFLLKTSQPSSRSNQIWKRALPLSLAAEHCCMAIIIARRRGRCCGHEAPGLS